MRKNLLTLYFALLTPLALCSMKSFESHLIIIGGGITYQDAVVTKDQYMQQEKLPKLIDTKVEVILSDTITGLNPGFYIAVLGIHSNKAYAELIINTINNFLKGAYIRKIEVKKPRNYMIPVLLAKEMPFEAQRYYSLEGLNNYFLADELDDGTRLKDLARYSSSYSEVYVNTSNIAFVKKQGASEVKYYLGWHPEYNIVLYVSQFQFSKIPKDLRVDFEGNIEWSCEGAGRRLNMSSEFKPYEFNETCTYSNGIETSVLRGYEYNNNQVKYPIDTYKFQEVLNYHLGKGHFRNLQDVNYETGEFSVDGYEIKFLENEISVETDDGHSWESLVIEDGFIIYNAGGGA